VALAAKPLTNRGSQGYIYRPPPRHTGADSPKFDAIDARRSRNAISARALIVTLLCWGRPAAVARLIVPVGVNAINRVPWAGPFAHVGGKSAEI
jgi:hypothetical protein